MPLRKATVAGQFYEDSAQNLLSTLNAALHAATSASAATQKTKKPARLVVLPHAGHFYCGHIIAACLTKVTLPSTLILLGPNHTGQGEALSVWSEGSWQTPLGDIPIATSVASRIVQCGAGFTTDTTAHMREHSLEVLLPFLQVTIPTLRIVPITVKESSFDALQKAGETLGNLVKTLDAEEHDTAFILSTDMHHFSDHKTTCVLDALALEQLVNMNPVGLANIVSQRNISMCGVRPAIIAMYALQSLGIMGMELVQHCTSFEKSGDASRVVGYAGLTAYA